MGDGEKEDMERGRMSRVEGRCRYVSLPSV